MPTYEYVCSSCKNEWEFEQSMKDNALTECPRCKEQTDAPGRGIGAGNVNRPEVTLQVTGVDDRDRPPLHTVRNN